MKTLSAQRLSFYAKEKTLDCFKYFSNMYSSKLNQIFSIQHYGDMWYPKLLLSFRK